MDNKFVDCDSLFDAISYDMLSKSFLELTDGTGTCMRVYLVGDNFGITDYDLLHAIHSWVHVPERALELKSRSKDTYGLFSVMMNNYEVIAGETGNVHNVFLFGLYMLSYMQSDQVKKGRDAYHLSIKLVVSDVGECNLFVPECVSHLPADMLASNLINWVDNPLYFFEMQLRHGAYSDMSEDEIDILRDSIAVSGRFFGDQAKCTIFVLAMSIISTFNTQILEENNFEEIYGDGSDNNNPNDFGGLTFV